MPRKENMKIVDANIILRYLLEDHAEYFEKAISIVEKNRILLINEVVAEVVYVLEKVYQIDRQTIKEGLFTFFENENIHIEKDNVLKEALILFAQKKLDFVDCLLFGYSKVGERKILTFDKKLLKYLDHGTVGL